MVSPILNRTSEVQVDAQRDVHLGGAKMMYTPLILITYTYN